MKLKNEQLLKSLINDNLILKNGSLNTRWKYLAAKKEYPFRSKLDMLKAIWTFDDPTCLICNSPINIGVFNTNFLDPDKKDLGFLCSKECISKYRSLKLSERRHDTEKEIKRVAAFVKAVSAKDENGVSVASKISRKAAQTKKKTFVNGISIHDAQIRKSHNTRVKHLFCAPYESISQFKLYRREVQALSNKQPLHLLSDNEKRGNYSNKGYHLDHVLSVLDGFRLSLSPILVSDITNLRFIPAIENTTKSFRSYITLGSLIERYFEYHFLNIPLENCTPFSR